MIMAGVAFIPKVKGSSRAMVAEGPRPGRNAHQGSEKAADDRHPEVVRSKKNGKTVHQAVQDIHGLLLLQDPNHPFGRSTSSQ